MTYELMPVDGKKSFYHKATVEVSPDDSRTLFSYGTKIMKVYPDGKMEKYWNGWSATTGRHIKAFSGLNKSGYLALDFVQE